MEPTRFLEQAVKNADELDSRDEINRVIDELEFIHEALDPAFQDLASDLVRRLSGRLEDL